MPPAIPSAYDRSDFTSFERGAAVAATPRALTVTLEELLKKLLGVSFQATMPARADARRERQ
jgi:hypothetical protein